MSKSRTFTHQAGKHARRSVLGLLVAVALVASACGGSSEPNRALAVTQATSLDPAPTPTAEPAASEPAQQAAPAEQEQAVAAAPTPEPVAPAAGQTSDEPEGAAAVQGRSVLATAPGSSKFPALVIHGFAREGNLVRLDFTVSVANQDPGNGFYVRRTFSSVEDSQLSGNASNSLEAASFSGISLVDNVNGNHHLVLRDTEGDCLCTSFPDYYINSDDYGDEFDVPGSALFPAPPADVTSMTVLFPVFGSFELALEAS